MDDTAIRTMLFGLVGGLLLLHVRVAGGGEAVIATALSLVVVTAGVTAFVTARYMTTREDDLSDLREAVARIREDQVRVRQRGDEVIIDPPQNDHE